MRSKLVQGRKSINCANSVLPAYILNPRERVPENLADTRFYVQVDTTPKAKIPSSTQQVARYSRVLSRTAVMGSLDLLNVPPDLSHRIGPEFVGPQRLPDAQYERATQESDECLESIGQSIRCCDRMTAVAWRNCAPSTNELRL